MKDFPPVSKSDWLDKVARDLKGKPIDELDHAWTKEITLSPFFHPEDLPNPSQSLRRAEQGMWHIGELIRLDDPVIANRELLIALNQGVNAPSLRMSRVLDTDEWDQVLEQVEPSFIELTVYPEFSEKEPARWLDPFLNAIRKRKISTTDLKGSLRIGEEAMPRALVEWSSLQEQLPGLRKLYIDATSCYQADKPEAELALAAYMTFYRMEECIKAGIDADQAHENLLVALAVDASFFRSLAKLRAFRLLWANLLQASDRKPENPPYLSVYFAPESQDDQTYTNMIRATTQGMSAVLGGADQLTVLPADASTGNASPFTRRVARNLQHVLSMEAQLDQVADPAAGSYFMEELTRQIAQKAFEIFQGMKPPGN